jgi:hypothetical protein
MTAEKVFLTHVYISCVHDIPKARTLSRLLGVSDPHWFWSAGSESGSRRAKKTHKNIKSQEISCFEVLDILFRGVKASAVAWDVLYRGLGITTLHFFILKNSALKFSLFLVIKTLDLDRDPDLDPDSHSYPYWPKILNPDPLWNQCGSETLSLFSPLKAFYHPLM